MKDRLKRRKFKRNYKGNFQLGKMTFGIVVVAIVFVFSLLYLSQSNKMALKGYDIAELKKEREELVAERERLEIESSRLQSIQEIEKGLEESKMEPVKKINYLPSSTSIALKH